jgi:transposase-like protein
MNWLHCKSSDVRDTKDAEKFFRQAQNTTGIVPAQITTDKEPALYSVVKNSFSAHTKHRDSKYLNNVLESDHRVTKSRLSMMKELKNIFCALKFFTVFEEIRQFFRRKNKTRSQRSHYLIV